MTLDEFCARLDNVKGGGNQRSARCPAHCDNNNSLSVGLGDDGRILLKCHAGCEPEWIVDALGLTMQDLFARPTAAQGQKKEVARYQYPGCVKIRYSDKSFAWYQPDTGKWKKADGVTLYNPDALQSDIVYVVEGEKDVDTLSRLGKSAVCGPNGAGKGKWPKEANKLFAGKYVVVLGDNDDVGRAFAEETANNLCGIAGDVKLVDLKDIWPEIPQHGDISDYLAAGGDIVKVDGHAAFSPNWEPGTEQNALKVKKCQTSCRKRRITFSTHISRAVS